MKDIREQRIERDQAAPRTETPMAMAIPMAEKVQGDTFTRAWAHVPGYAPVLDIPIRSNLIANVILISESLNALLLISSFLLSVKSVRCSLSLSLSLSLAHSGSLDSYATQCVRMCDWIWWTFGPLLWAFFLQRDPLYVLGLSLLKRERNEMEMCTKETKSRFQLNFTRSCC